MDLVLRFNFAAQVIAALVVFIFGYIALFGSLMVCLAIAMSVYAGTKRVWVCAVKSISANKSLLSNVETPDYRAKHAA